MLKFRNIEATPDDEVELWGSEGIVTAIERGSIEHWAKIIRAVKRDPWGDVSLDLEEALEVAQNPGVIATLRTCLLRARENDNARVARKVRELVTASGKSRAELAEILGTSRSRLSSYENGHVMPAASVTEKLREIVEDRRHQFVP